MGLNRDVKTICTVAVKEYLQWIRNPKMLLVGVFLVFMKAQVITPLVERGERYGQAIGKLEPFLAMCNSPIIMMMVPLFFMLLVSDYPKITGNTMLYMHRIGKLRWFLGHVMFILMSIVSYIGILIVYTLLATKGEFYTNWSEVVLKYEARFPREAGSHAYKLLPMNLFQQMNLWEAFWISTSLIILYLFCIALTLYLSKMLRIPTIGLVTSGAVVACGYILALMETKGQWIFPMAHTQIAIHYRALFQKPIVRIEWSYLYFISCLLLLFLGNIVGLKKLQLTQMDSF